jgi:hypothetical protein
LTDCWPRPRLGKRPSGSWRVNPESGRRCCLRRPGEEGVELGVRVLSARGGELEREFSFGVVRQLFETELAVEEDREQALGDPAGAARPVFVLSDPAQRSTAAADPSFAALHGLYWLMINLSAAGPLLVQLAASLCHHHHAWEGWRDLTEGRIAGPGVLSIPRGAFVGALAVGFGVPRRGR